VTKDELLQLRDALDATLALPDDIRLMLARWLCPEGVAPSVGNGHDRSPSPPVKPAGPRPISRFRRQSEMLAQARADEQALLDVVRQHPGSGVVSLSRWAGQKSASVGERLKRLAKRGEVEKVGGPGGGWRIVEREAQDAGDAEPRPTPPL
jgi:hypothetical protein